MGIKKLTTISIIGLFFFPIVSCIEKNTLPDPLIAGWNNQPVCELIEDNEKLRVLKCTFEPGIGHKKHYHDPHFGFTLSGSTFRITDESGTREVVVNSNTSFYSEGTEWHEVLNIGDSTAVFLIMEPK